MLLMDGDMSPRSLSFAKNYGDITYINNKNTEGNKIINLMLCEEQWKEQLRADLTKFYEEDPSFRVCIASQGASKIDALYIEIKEQMPHLTVRKLTGTDGGATKKLFLEDINETLADTNVFLYSPVIEAGVDITVKVKKVYGILSAMSNSQRAFMQMINRCRNVEEPRMDFLKGEGLHINSDYKFWKYSDVLKNNRDTVDTTRMEFLVEDGELRLKETALSKQRKNISVYNTTETLNKHPSIFINYLKVLTAAKGIKFQIQAVPEEQKGQPKKKTKKNVKAEQIMSAKDLTYEEFEELSLKKKSGMTTTEENLQVDKWHHLDYLETSELKEEILVAHIYGQKPYENFLALVDRQNHYAEDNLRSDKQLERVQVAERLIQLLGWEHARDENQLKKEVVRDNFVEKVVKDPLFKKQLRLNELFGLEKAYNIHAEMKPLQILMWANSLLKPFCLQVKAGEKAYRLEPQLEVLDWIARKNKRGRIYKDSRNLLNQQVRKQVVEGEEDLFLDDEPGASQMPKTGICDEKPKAKKARAKKPFDTSRLDVGINADDE
jgi:pterin-4a-carbinolamine dehydratase